MATNLRRSLLVAGALAAFGGMTSVQAAATQASGTRASYDASTPLVLAQAPAPGMTSERAVAPGDAYPAYQRGVREAARQGPEALRRYIWRTRMIYNFYYPDFVLN